MTECLDISIKMTEYCVLQVVSALRFEIFRKENTFKSIFFVEESLMVRLEKLLTSIYVLRRDQAN